MKKVAEFESELIVVEGKTKAEIVAFVKTVLDALKERENAVNNDPIIIGLTNELDDAKKKIELGNGQALRIESLENELEIAKNVALEATNKFNSLSTETPTSRTIKIDGKECVINHGVNLNGKDYTAEQLAADKATSKKLFDMGSTAVTLKEDK